MQDKYEILCYGDSNTFGTVARWSDDEPEKKRYGRQVRWPCVLQEQLGNKFFITEAGLSGRTTVYDSPDGEYLNGKRLLLPTLMSARPLDLVIFLLGTNDLHLPEPLPLEKMGIGISELVELVLAHPEYGRNDKAPDILVVAPSYICRSSPNGRTDVYRKFFYEYGERESRMFPEVYRAVAERYHCYYMSAADFAAPDEADGVHFTAAAHISLGKAVADKVKEIAEHLPHQGITADE